MKLALSILALLSALLVAAAPVRASGPVILVSGGGQVLDREGQALADYAYLQPGGCYRIEPGARAELSSPDGASIYRAHGPGLLCLDSNGVLSLNGRELNTNGHGPSPVSAPEKGHTPGPPGAGSLMGQEARATAPCRALVVGCDAYGQAGSHVQKMAAARQAAKYLATRGWRVEFLSNPRQDHLSQALSHLVRGDKAKSIVFWFSGLGLTGKDGLKSRGPDLALADTVVGKGETPHSNALAFSKIERLMSLRKEIPLAVVLDLDGIDNSLSGLIQEQNHYLALAGGGCGGFAQILKHIKTSGRDSTDLGRILGGLCSAAKRANTPPRPTAGPIPPGKDDAAPQDITEGLFPEKVRPAR